MPKDYNAVKPEFQESLNKQFKENLDEIQAVITELKDMQFADFTENSLIRMNSTTRNFKFFLKQIQRKK